MTYFAIALLGICAAAGAWLLGLCGGASKAAPAPAPALVQQQQQQRQPAAPAPPAAPGTFDPSKSRVDPEVRMLFITDENSMEACEGTVPGVGPANAKLLKRKGVHTVAHLLGMFLRLRDPQMTPQEHCDAFNRWLADCGITASRHSITMVVADKCGSLMPALRYDTESIVDAS